MSERNGSTSVGTGTAEIPVVRPPGSSGPAGSGSAAPAGGEPAAVPPSDPAAGTQTSAPDTAEPAPGLHPTAPVSSRPAPPESVPNVAAPVGSRPVPRAPRRGPLTVMGPWAPVAGGLLGLLLGVVAVLFLAGSAERFEERLALVFTVLGLGMLGTAGILLADEVRMLRQSAREASIRPAWVEATAGLLNGLTPARLLLVLSGFVLFLAAYVSRG